MTTFKKTVLLIIVLSIAYIANNRGRLISQSEVHAGTITSCEGKWVKVRSNSTPGSYRDQLQSIPMATTESGVSVRGTIMLPNREICNLSLGSNVSVLLNAENSDHNRIYSFVQFWALPVLFGSIPLIVLIALYSTAIGRVVTILFVVGFGTAVTHELGLLKRWAPFLYTSSSFLADSAPADGLERCIHAAMKKEGVSRENVKKLSCQEAGVTDLKGLGDLVNLEGLYLQGNALTSLESIPSLPKLKAISVAANKQLSNIKGVERLPALEEFQANKSGITDLAGLEQLRDLKVVGLMMNNIRDVSVFRDLEKLENVNFNYNPVADISAFKNKGSLIKFGAHATKITDITPLLNSTKLEVLGVSSPDFSCDQLTPFRSTLPETAKVFGPTHCNEPS